MNLKRTRRGRVIPALIGCFYLGLAAGWWTRGKLEPAVTTASAAAPAPVAAQRPAERQPVATAGTLPQARPLDRPDRIATTDPVAVLRERHLRLPVDGIRIDALKGQFDDPRDGGRRGHEAVDMLAPTGTPVRAVEAGTIEKLFTSKAGGLTIYQFDASGRFCYYYAHLDRYAPGLREKQTVARGDIIGQVGTSGNAPANTPHLHFAIVRLDADRRWWKGQPLDPYLVYAPDRTDVPGGRPTATP